MISPAQAVEARIKMTETARHMRLVADRIDELGPSIPRCLDVECTCSCGGAILLRNLLLAVSGECAALSVVVDAWAADTLVTEGETRTS